METARGKGTEGKARNGEKREKGKKEFRGVCPIGFRGRDAPDFITTPHFRAYWGIHVGVGPL